jgi:superfamily II DNA or RNA helicase
LSNASADDVANAWRVLTDPAQEWIPSVMHRADQELTRIRSELPNAAGIIFAPSKKHADAYADIMQTICGERVTVVYSEMDGDPNAEIVAFAQGTARWICAVKMVSEGVDIPRLAVGVYASRIFTEMWFRQVVGRIVRISGPEDSIAATMFIPDIAQLVEMAQRIEREADAALIQAEREITDRAEQSTGTFELSFIEALRASPADLSQIIAKGETITAEEIEQAEALRIQLGMLNFHAADIARIVKAVRGSTPVAKFDVPVTALVSGDDERRILRKRLNLLVSRLASRKEFEHKQIHVALNRMFGGNVPSADADALRKRIDQVNTWLAQ